MVFKSEFLAQIRNQGPKIDPCAKFQPNWTKDKGSRILTSDNSENYFMTSHRRDGDVVIKVLLLLRDFVPEYHRAKFGGDWTTHRQTGNIGGGGGGDNVPLA